MAKTKTKKAPVTVVSRFTRLELNHFGMFDRSRRRPVPWWDWVGKTDVYPQSLDIQRCREDNRDMAATNPTGGPTYEIRQRVLMMPGWGVVIVQAADVPGKGWQLMHSIGSVPPATVADLHMGVGGRIAGAASWRLNADPDIAYRRFIRVLIGATASHYMHDPAALGGDCPVLAALCATLVFAGDYAVGWRDGTCDLCDLDTY